MVKTSGESMETRFWELLAGFFGSPLLAKNQVGGFRGFSETEWEGYFEVIWKMVKLADGFLGRKLENPVKGVFTEKGVIEVSVGSMAKFRVLVERTERDEHDSIEAVMVALARSGLGVKRVVAPTAVEVSWDPPRDSPSMERLADVTRQCGVDERPGWGWQGVDGKWYPTLSAVRGADAATRTPTDQAPTPAKEEVCEQHPAGPHARFLKSACPWCQGRGDYFGPNPTPSAPLNPPPLGGSGNGIPETRVGACEAILTRMIERTRETDGQSPDYVARDALYDAWGAGYRTCALTAPALASSVTEERLLKDIRRLIAQEDVVGVHNLGNAIRVLFNQSGFGWAPGFGASDHCCPKCGRGYIFHGPAGAKQPHDCKPSDVVEEPGPTMRQPPEFPSAKCQKCGAWLISYMGDTAFQTRCPSCTRPAGVTLFPDTSTKSAPKPIPDHATSTPELALYTPPPFTGFMDYKPLVGVREPELDVSAAGGLVDGDLPCGCRRFGNALRFCDEHAKLYRMRLAARRGLPTKDLPELTDTPELATWRSLADGPRDSPGIDAIRLRRALAQACARIDELEAENSAILEGAQEWEYEAKAAKRELAALAGKDPVDFRGRPFADGLKSPAPLMDVRMPTVEEIERAAHIVANAVINTPSSGDYEAEGVDDDELTPAEPLPPPPPPVETQIQGAVAEESAELFNWLEKRMRLNSDKAEERTRVFTTLNQLAQRVVALCRAP